MRSKIADKIDLDRLKKVAQHLDDDQNRMNLTLIIAQYCPDLRIAVVYIQIKTGINQLQCITEGCHAID